MSFALILLSSLAWADVSTPTPTPTPTDTSAESPCAELAEGDACETTDGEAGTCDASGVCVVEDKGCGCTFTGTPFAAAGMTALAIGLLAARRRRA